MRLTGVLAIALLAVILVPATNFPQGGQMESTRNVAGGGVSVPGWTGKIDAKEAAAGMTLNSAKLTKDGDALLVTTGPAVTYCNTGHWAATDWFVLHELLGRSNARLYAGSMVEWTSNASRPVESARTKWDDLKKKLGLGS